jgi:hypothetical protein
MKRITGILFLFVTLTAFAQKQDKPIVQFTGITNNADSATAIVPYVTISNKATHKVVNITNYEGYFSFVAHEQDTLLFTSVGYAATSVIIPANVANKSYTVKILMHPQIINLPVFHVFPWATTDEFKKDFLSMKIADDDLEIARKNINRTTLAALNNVLPRDGEEIQESYFQGLNSSIMSQHSLTPNPLLNPLAWGSLINEISQGDKSRQTGD